MYCTVQPVPGGGALYRPCNGPSGLQSRERPGTGHQSPVARIIPTKILQQLWSFKRNPRERGHCIGNNAVGIKVIAGEEEEGVESDDLEKSWRMKEEKSLYQLVP